MDHVSLSIFISALNKGMQKIFHIRIMVVGQYGVGKTTFTVGILGDAAVPYRQGSTNGIDIYVGRCRIDRSNGEWILTKYAQSVDKRNSAKMVDVLRKIEDEDIQEAHEKRKKSKEIQFESEKDYESSTPSVSETETKYTIAENEQNSLLPSTMKVEATGNIKIGKTAKKGGKIKTKKSDQTDLEQDFTHNQLGLQQRKKIEKTKETPSERHQVGTKKFKDRNAQADTTTNAKKMLEELVEYNKSSHCAVDKEYIDVEIWDFGGQKVFQTSQQTFLSSRCLYTLMVNALSLNEQIGYIDFWVNTIIIYAKGKHQGFPKIILIGTHVDKIPLNNRKSRVKKIFADISKHFKGHLAENHLIIDPTFCLNASDKNDKVYDRLREAICKISKSYPFWGEERPAYWIPLERSLSLLREQKDIKIISIKDVKDINSNSSFASLSTEELSVFLEFHHSLGTWLYFKEGSLSEYVILDPKWLIDALTSIITDEQFCREDPLKRQIWGSLSTTGSVKRNLISELWKLPENSQFGKYESHLLKTMEKFDLVVQPKVYDEEGIEKETQIYFIPSMLNSDVPEVITKTLSVENSVSLIFEFEGKFLPPALFYRLLGSCIKMWPILSTGGKPIMYSSMVGFSLDDFHDMYLQRLNHHVLLVIKQTQDKMKPSPSLCQGMKCYIEYSLQKSVEVYDWVRESGGNNQKEIYSMKVPCCINHLDCLRDLSEQFHAVEATCQHHSTECLTEIGFPFKTDLNLEEKSSENICEMNCKGVQSFNDSEADCLSNKELGRLSRQLSCQPLELSCMFDMKCTDLHEITEDYPISSRGLREQYFRILSKGATNDIRLKELEDSLRLAEKKKHVLCTVLRKRKQIIEPKIKGEIMFQKPSLKMLNELADRIDAKLAFQLFLELEIDVTRVIDRIRVDFPNNVLRQMREIFKVWSAKDDQRPTMRCLSQAMMEVGIDSRILAEISPAISAISN